MPLSLTPEGLVTQTQEEIVEELGAKARATFGNNTNTSTSSFLGQLFNIFGELRALDQQTLLAVYQSFDRNQALGVSLDQRGALTGSVRDGATNSVVEGLIEFSGPGTTVNGDLIQNDDNQTQWEVINGPYSDTGGPYPEFVAGTYQAVDTGPILANAGTNWSLITLPAGVAGFTNPTDDANLGQDQQTDPAFRRSQQVELFARGTGPLAAISGVVSKVDGVSEVRTYHNPATSPVDANGIPFKAFNVVVETNPPVPGAQLEQDIADAIFSATGAGGEAFGTDVGPITVTDIEGEPHDVFFDLISLQDVFINVTLDTTGTEQPVSENLAQVVEDAILEAAQTLYNGIGRDQLGFEYTGVVNNLALTGEISGVTLVTVELSTVAIIGPYLDPLPIGLRQRPDFDSANIVVTVI